MTAYDNRRAGQTDRLRDDIIMPIDQYDRLKRFKIQVAATDFS